jgi:hypothetical protein
MTSFFSLDDGLSSTIDYGPIIQLLTQMSRQSGISDSPQDLFAHSDVYQLLKKYAGVQENTLL